MSVSLNMSFLGRGKEKKITAETRRTRRKDNEREKIATEGTAGKEGVLRPRY